MRTDIHRPSAIQPEDYEFVGCEVVKVDTMVDALSLLAEREAIRAHMQRTGGTYSQHAHGGNCHVCGNPNAIYTVLFWHQPTNVYIRVGSECADKMDCGDPSMFRRLTKLRDGVNAARKAKAGKAKAEAFLVEAGVQAAWAVYTADRQDSDGRQEEIIRDVVDKLVRFGSLSEAQVGLLQRLIYQIEHRAEIEAERQAEREAAAPVPSGRAVVRGKILSFKNSDFGGVRMLVRHDQGFKVFGSLPAALCDAQVGDEVEFTAMLKPSDRDEKFGFFSRPTKARKLSGQAAVG